MAVKAVKSAEIITPNNRTWLQAGTVSGALINNNKIRNTLRL